ncbi:hypothetical protein HBH98_067900 [Parastagonospora nodorum]|nr:hypothetical protein HBH50_100380 [Parastagonospora nodorum]KAH4089944.1 hypothetical protein HBH48_104160 [Parastagonospora nodorum]KAH4125317.1 hypothetical protein HBH47_065180 [Parastagonospora nodorum]KAH4173960.1 hypothetical protein HBH43_085290 [Parastagonospora nodorum]KAH4182860.1 hypothetical protein HBH42_214910 [Parastagonospora nodorum]
MSSRPETWPDATGDLLPNTLFKIAEQYPDLVYAEYFTDPVDIAKGHRKVTYRDFANAVHTTAWWIEENVGKPKIKDGSETIVYLGPNDLTYGILVMASIVVGYKMLFPSPRYGAEAIAKLIEHVDGNIMLSTTNPFPVHAEILARRPMRTYVLPSLPSLYATKSPHHPFTKTYAEHKHEHFVCLHTSGTTGFPKPILWTHEFVNANFQGYYLPPTNDGRELTHPFTGTLNRIMVPFPAFHTSGIVIQCFVGLATGSTILLPPPADSPGGVVDVIADTLDYLGSGPDAITTLTLPPPHMEYLARHPALLSRISARVARVGFGGGDISALAGNTIAAKLQILNEFGSTENGLWPAVTKPQNALWHYASLHPALNFRLDPVSESPDGTVCEAVLVKNPGAFAQPLFTMYPHETERKVGDLFIRHPEYPQLWRHYGRADDLLNFSTSETFHPAAAERRIAGHECVEEVLMVGTMRPVGALIVRLAQGKGVDDLWSVVEEVNQTSPVYARVRRDMILVVTEAFPTTAKGTVQKKATVDKYKKELDGLYEKVGVVDVRIDIPMTP